MRFKHSMSIVQQLIPFYNTTVHKNKSTVALNCLWHKLKTPTGHKGGVKNLNILFPVWYDNMHKN